MRAFLLTSLFSVLLGVTVNLYGAHNITESAVEQLGPESIPELCDVALSQDPADDDIRLQAIQRLGELKATNASIVLIDILDTVRTVSGGKLVYDWRLKTYCAKALSDIGDPKSVDFLARMVRSDDDLIVKRAAVQALGLLGETARTTGVLDVLHDQFDTTRDNAFVSDLSEALGKIGDRSSFYYLLQVTQGPWLNSVKETAQKSISMLKWDRPSVYDKTGKGNVPAAGGAGTNPQSSQYTK